MTMRRAIFFRLSYSFNGAALLLDEQALDGLVSSGAQLLYKAVHAVHLTAEADGYNAVDVGIGCHAHQHVLRPAKVARGFAAAVLVYEADGAVDAVCRLARGL